MQMRMEACKLHRGIECVVVLSCGSFLTFVGYSFIQDVQHADRAGDGYARRGGDLPAD